MKNLKGIIPSDMKVPKFRLDFNLQNLAWLCRNLKVKNGDHPKIEETMKEIIQLRKDIVKDEPPQFPISLGDLHI